MTNLKVNVVFNYPQEGFCSVESRIDESPLDLTVLYVPIPRDANLDVIDSVLNHLPITAKSPSIIVFRFHKPDLNRLNTNGHNLQIKLVAKRYSQASIYILNWDGGSEKFSLTKQGLNQSKPINFNTDKLVESLRHSELHAMIHQTNTLLKDDANYHYAFANGNHYKKFLRVSNALSSKDTLDSISFWLLPFLKTHPLILLDSNSIIALGLNIIHYCHDCDETDHKDWFGKVECLKDYHESETDLLIRLSKSTSEKNYPKTVLNIFSAKSTGRLCQKIKDACKESELEIVQNIVLYSVKPPTDVPDEIIFCALDDGFKGHPQKDCPICAQNSTPIDIDEKSYTLNLPAAANPVSLDLKSIRPVADFFKQYGNSQCFSVHRDQHDGQRHHMIHIDISKLVNHPTFSQKVATTASRLRGNVDLLLVPEHHSAEALAEKVNQVLRLPVIICDHNKLGTLDQKSKSLIKESKRILIVDDVVISGIRINNYKEFLDRYELKTEHTVLKVLVGVARPETEEELEGIKDYLYPKTNFEYIEKLLLPNWDHDFCPWCWEEAKLSNSDGKLSDDQYLINRYNSLKNKQAGLTKDLFLQWSSEPRLKHGARYTVFGPTHDEVEIFVAIASVIQNMRSSKILNDARSTSSPIAKVHNVKKYLKGRYYEDFIRACILRSSVKEDVRCHNNEAELRKKITEMIHSEEHSRVFIPELILNMAQRKLPLVTISNGILNDGGVGIGSFLKLLYET